MLVAVTGRRWIIEEDHEFCKDQFGFDQFQVRRHTPIMRHIVLVMAALAICAVGPSKRGNSKASLSAYRSGGSWTSRPQWSASSASRSI
ncbi:hypothetical protein ACN28C_19480 [Plantactinospora sp. WMMC1484]|uniref:hypothetical protein n=1 Tax=Plantactinospora sp. WMMC1484 TaxID=3404122 RepID=UPI003BF5BCB5